MDEEILETAKSICACGAEDEALLKRLCAASAQALERELREGVAPEDCVSVADNVKRDITGAKEAGIACNIIFRSPEKKHAVEFTDANRPDAVIDDFRQILDLLPPLD